MIAFAVKNILRKAVLTENFSYNKASGIYDYLIKHFEQDPQKKYFFLESETIYVKQPQKKTCYIKNFQKLPHDLFPPWVECLNQTKYLLLPVITTFRGNSLHALKKKDHSWTISKSSVSPQTLPLRDDTDCEEDDDMEGYEMRANSVIEIIKKDNISALFSPPESLELFYLCTVIEVGVAIERIVDKHNHSIKSGWHYVKCCYLEKIKEWKSMIKYKLYDAVCVLLTQVMNPLVVLNENLGSPSRNINGFQIACNFKE